MFKINLRIHILLGFLSALFITLFITQISFIAGKPATYLIFILLITVQVWFGGLRLGLFTVFYATLSVLIFYTFQYPFPSTPFLASLYESVLFTVTGTIICLFIEKYKKTDIIREHLRREKLLHEKIYDLEIDIEKMKKEVKMRDEFLSIASHELKTPLTSMLLKIQSILHNIRNVSLANFSVQNLMNALETAEGQTKRLSQMINDLLNVSLITTGKMKLEKKEEDLAEIVKEVLNEFKERFQVENILVTLNIEKNSISASVDKIRIEQVLSNLITNAIKYGDDKPIIIKVDKNNSKAWIKVIDKGIGIPKEKIDKIFSLFERGEHGKEMQGLGVGLYIAHQIVKAHNGKLKVNSIPTKGSEFMVELPIK